MTIPQGLVDAHVHYWNPSVLPYAWLDGLPQLNKPFLPGDFADASSQAGVSKTLFVEANCDTSRSLDEVDWVASLAIQEPRIRGIVAHAPLEWGVGAKDHLAQLARQPLVRGVRRVLQGEDSDFCVRPEFLEGVGLLEPFGFTMDLCIRHDQLAAATELVGKFPGVRFILDHFGKPTVKSGEMEPWRGNLKALAAHPNVSCKVSGLTTEADWERWMPADLVPYFDAVFESFGPNRVIYGGDWPVCLLASGYGRWIETVATLTTSLTAEDAAKLFRTNAEKTYRI